MEHKYLSIDNYYKAVGNMLGDPVVITEKLDGCNFSVHLKHTSGECADAGWTFDYRSRNQKANEAEGSLFYEAISIINEVKHDLITLAQSLLVDEIVFYFEVIGRGVQKRIEYKHYFEDTDYRHLNGRTIALIDIYLPTENQWLVWTNICEIADRLDIYRPKFFRREALTLTDIETIVENEDDVEGWVIRGETHDAVLIDYRGNRKIVKAKTNKFLSYEKKGPKNKKAKAPTPPEIIDFLVTRINFGRLHSVYSHGHDTLNREMADMKYLPDLVIEDIKAEDSSIWEQGFEEAAIKKTVARMLPNILRGFLLEGQTNE